MVDGLNQRIDEETEGHGGRGACLSFKLIQPGVRQQTRNMRFFPLVTRRMTLGKKPLGEGGLRGEIGRSPQLTAGWEHDTVGHHAESFSPIERSTPLVAFAVCLRDAVSVWIARYPPIRCEQNTSLTCSRGYGRYLPGIACHLRVPRARSC